MGYLSLLSKFSSLKCPTIILPSQCLNDLFASLQILMPHRENVSIITLQKSDTDHTDTDS